MKYAILSFIYAVLVFSLGNFLDKTPYSEDDLRGVADSARSAAREEVLRQQIAHLPDSGGTVYGFDYAILFRGGRACFSVGERGVGTCTPIPPEGSTVFVDNERKVSIREQREDSVRVMILNNTLFGTTP